MNWADMAVPLVAAFEGCHRQRGGLIHPYLDTLAKPPVWTRGYGRTYGITQESSAITKDEAKEELKAGLAQYARKVLILALPLGERPACLAAVASWTWNCGVGAFKWSRLRKAINEGRWADAVEHIKTPRTAGGVVYPGLIRRREAESALFAKGIEDIEEVS